MLMPMRVGLPSYPYSFLIEKRGNLIVAQDSRGRIQYSGTDAASVIQSAINALTSGGKIFIKNGTYTFPNPNVLTPSLYLNGDSNITLEGEEGVVFERSAGRILQIENSTNITIKNIKFYHSTNSYATAIFLRGVQYNINIIDNIIEHASGTLGTPWDAIACDTDINCSIYGYRIVGNKIQSQVDGISLRGGYGWICNNEIWEYGLINGNAGGITFTSGPNDDYNNYDVHICGNKILLGSGGLNNVKGGIIFWKKFTNVLIESNYIESGTHGIDICPPAGLTNTKNISIKNNVIFGAQTGIYVQNTEGSIDIANNIIDGNTTTQTSGYEGIYLYGSSTNRMVNVKTENNLIRNVGYHGIFFNRVDYGKVSGNLIYAPMYRGAEFSNCTYLDIIDNSVRDSTGNGIYLYATTYSMLQDNRILITTGSYEAIVEAGASDYNNIKNNRVAATKTPYIVKVGANTIVSANVGYVTENGGTATFSGNGTTTTFTIPHGLAGTPKSWRVEAGSADAKGDKYVTADATNLTVTFATAPPAGTNNVVLVWQAEM
jgi:parallel beta-helix repeat protein